MIVSPSVVKNFKENPKDKDLYCGVCNSLIPPPGFFCVKCGAPEGPVSVVEGELTFLKMILRCTLLILLFIIIAVFRLDIKILEILPNNQDIEQINVEGYEDFKIILKVNAAVANIRDIPNIKSSKIIDSIPIGTQVNVNGVEGDWSKIQYRSGPKGNLNTGWIATRLLDSEIK